MKIRIKDKNDLKDFLEYESKKYQLKTASFPYLAIKERQILYRCNYLLRKTEYYINCKKKIRKALFKILLTRYERKHHMFIPVNVFDRGLYFIHLGSRLVNKNAVVGKNCIMHINTCIVAGGDTNKCPVIGDNVILGIHSIVSGNAIVGNNVAIGANAFVNKDFSDGNMTIAGIPAKKISDNTYDNWGENANHE